MSCRFLLQGFFLTQGSNPCLLCLLPCRWILYLLSHWGSPCYHYLSQFCARELGQGPVGLAHFCCPFSVAPSFSTICSRVASAGIIGLTDLALSRAPPFSGVDSRFLSLFFLWPLHVVPSGRWLEFSCESSRIPNKDKWKWLVLKAQARNCQRVTSATFY